MKPLYGIPLGLASVLVTEHALRVYDVHYRPSTAIKFTATQCQNLFELIGKGFAKLSSFYDLIDLTELKVTIDDVFRPSFETVISPWYFINGYNSQMNLAKSPTFILFGSLTLAIIVSYLARKYGLDQRLLNYCRPKYQTLMNRITTQPETQTQTQ